MSNDMHIAHTIPNIWYEVDLKAPGPNGSDFHVAGVSNPGAPFVTAGHNDHISWGFTSLYGDTRTSTSRRSTTTTNIRLSPPGSPSSMSARPSVSAAAMTSSST